MSFRSICLLLALFGCSSDGGDDKSGPCVDGVDCPEDCVDEVDNDGDGAVDCVDEDCDGKCWEICDDGRDNDGDGLKDCDDTDCLGQCPEDCLDGMDNDGDGLVDCQDIDCTDLCAEECDDEKDNDGDGAVDCEDDECDGDCPENCEDGRDNDGDGVADCDDPDCTDECPEDCEDGLDNDADGLVDCDDIECTDVCEEDCTDEQDNDGDGAVDCEDDECDGACPENCADGRDNDGDGLVDCEDADCSDTESCVEVCDDTIDNDADGLIDCKDDDCWGPDCHPDGLKARVTGGTMKVQEKYSYVFRSSSCGSGSMFRYQQSSGGKAYNVVGSIKAKPRGEATWITCDFEADTVSFGRSTFMAFGGSSYSYGSGYRAVVRHNFKVDDKCALGDDWFLPQQIRGSSGMAVTDTSVNWYIGKITDTTQTSSYFYNTSCYSSVRTNSTAWDVKLTTGEPFATK